MNTRTDSHHIAPENPRHRRRESAAVCIALAALAIALHTPSLFRPDRYVFSPADILARQPELGGSAAYVPANRLLIDPVLQFEPWEELIRHESVQRRFAWWNPWSGTGAPLAANGQSRMFDPVAWMFRLAPSPWDVAAQSAFRFVVTGLGIFVLCRSLGFGPWVRCWAALTLPLTGFFTLWRLYPLTTAGSAVPWMWLAFVRTQNEHRSARSAVAALGVAWVIVAGNVQIAAVGLIGLVPLFAMCQWGRARRDVIRTATRQVVAVAAGLMLAAPSWVGLADYLVRSPVWSDRLTEHTGTGRGAQPRWADLPCLVFPFIYGSERGGDANVAKAVGATNVNEAASGHVGLLASLVLIPSALSSRAIGRDRRLFLFSISFAAVGLWVAYRLPPIHAIWARIPLFQGIDPRRFVFLTAIGGTVLAGIGLERIASGEIGRRFERWAPRLWFAVAFGCCAVAVIPLFMTDRLEAQARKHYERSIAQGAEHERIVALRVADQVAGLTRAWPAYLIGRGLWMLGLIVVWQRTSRSPRNRAAMIGTLAIAEGFAFGWNYNPHIDRTVLAAALDMRTIESMKRLDKAARAAGHEARFLAVGECLPPNQLMRFGLKDLRNYDSIELESTLTGLGSLFESEGAKDRSSRRAITWAGVERSAEALKDRGVIGVVGLTEPPVGLFDAVLRPLSDVFIGVWASRPRVEGAGELIEDEPGRMTIRLNETDARTGDSSGDSVIVLRIRESFDPGWHADAAGNAGIRLEQEPDTGMMRCVVPTNLANREIRLSYRPAWLDLSLAAMGLGAAFCLKWLIEDVLRGQKSDRLVLFSPTGAGLKSIRSMKTGIATVLNTGIDRK